VNCICRGTAEKEESPIEDLKAHRTTQDVCCRRDLSAPKTQDFAAHRLILAKNSEVFDRMLSQRWNGEKKDLEMVEDAPCQKVFPAFLRFLYCNHVVLHQDNCLPILILADKYNVISLKKVCIDFAISEILPNLTLKDVFSIWFSYATKAYHQVSSPLPFNLIVSAGFAVKRLLPSYCFHSLRPKPYSAVEMC
ncbi:BTB/POZ domain protein, partial [Ostertagia ostertagi]